MLAAGRVTPWYLLSRSLRGGGGVDSAKASRLRSSKAVLVAASTAKRRSGSRRTLVLGAAWRVLDVEEGGCWVRERWWLGCWERDGEEELSEWWVDERWGRDDRWLRGEESRVL
jgi:hypothetical protein